MNESQERLERIAMFRELPAEEQARLLEEMKEDEALRRAWEAYRRQDDVLADLASPRPRPDFRSDFYEALETGGRRPSWWAMVGRAAEVGGRVAFAVAGIAMIVAAALMIRGQMLGGSTLDQGAAGAPTLTAVSSAARQTEEAIAGSTIAAYPAPQATRTPAPYEEPGSPLPPTPTMQPYPYPYPPPDAEANATSLPEGWDVATPVLGPMQMRLSGWSPDSRYLAYWQIDSEQADVQYPAGALTFLDVRSGDTCSYDRTQYDGADGKVWRHTWLDDGRLLVFNQDGSYSLWQVCSGQLPESAGRAPDTIERIVAASEDGRQWLLLTADAYFLAALEGEQLRFVPVSGLTPTLFDAATFSPDDTRVAIHLSTGGTYVVDVASATVVRRSEWQSSGGLGDIFAPVWLDEERLLVRSSAVDGALLIDPDGETTPVGPELFGHEPSPALVGEGVAQTGGGYVIAGHYMPGSQNDEQGVWIATSDGQVESLAPFDRAVFTPNGERLILFVESNGAAGAENEVWWADVATLPLNPQSLYTGHDFPYSATSPSGAAVAVAAGNDLYILTESGVVEGSNLPDVLYAGSPYWSPDGNFLALAGGFSGRPENYLYVIAVP